MKIRKDFVRVGPGAVGFGAAVFVVEGRPFLRLTSAAFSGLLTYVFLGAAFQWKPFRPPPRPEDDQGDEAEPGDVDLSG